MTQDEMQQKSRRQWMGVLAKAPPDTLARLWQGLNDLPAWDYLRRPEIGLVMVRGRMGGDGAPFNLGEMTVTRCSVRLGGGTVGHAWVAGRDSRHAELAAVADALLQLPAWHDRIEAAVVAPLRAMAAQATHAAAVKAGATRVDFFTLVRGED